jgi:hypothetical protein
MGAEMVDSEKILFAPGDHVTVGINPRGLPMLAYEPHPDYGAAPGIWLGLEFSAGQARNIGQALIDTADEVERRAALPLAES